VKLNEVLQVDVLYNTKNSDKVIYELALVYEDKQVAKKNFYFSSFDFRLMDLFPDFKPVNPYLDLIVTIIDPEFIENYS